MLLVSIIAGVVKVSSTQTDHNKRILALESKVNVQWKSNKEIEDEMKIAELNTTNHQKEADKDIDNIKGNCAADRFRLERLESLHLKKIHED